jgi:glycine/D-amino acid oxidase-like deaminating enzyme
MNGAAAALRDAAPRPFWTDRAGAPEPTEPLSGQVTADLVVVGGGFTGLWTALLAKERDPGTDVVVLEARSVAHGASGRNGGFISESLTHGLEHGIARWPQELEELLLMGRENVAAIAAFVWSHDIAADLRLVGKTVCAVRPHEVGRLEAAARLQERHGESAVFLSREEVQADVRSPTYLAGLRVRSGGGLLDPAALCWGMLRVATHLGVRVHENTAVTAVEADRNGVRVASRHGVAVARQAVVATNAYVEPLSQLRRRVLPVYDHVLVTEPLNQEQLRSIGWQENQGLTDAGNRFHYYRRTPDDRILWGGYDAIYHFGNAISEQLEQREASHRRLAESFFATFPQLQGVRFSHRWAGVTDVTSRFTPMFGTTAGGGAVYAAGFTGLGVGSSRFAANTMLDMLEGAETPRTRLEMVRRRPMPFPPEPLRYCVVQATRAALAREDRTGRRGTWLRTLDRLGVGFSS